jgi:hypothetical protein
MAILQSTLKVQQANIGDMYVQYVNVQYIPVKKWFHTIYETLHSLPTVYTHPVVGRLEAHSYPINSFLATCTHQIMRIHFANF